MIKLINGDLLEATENIIVHQVNCQGKFGSGIALQIRNKFPSAYNDYMNFCSRNKPLELLGKTYISNVGKDKYIAHIFGQLNYGYEGKRYTSYDALYEGLKYVKEHAQRVNYSVAIPYKLGSDRGGADWDIVYKMIEKVFDDYEVTLYKFG